MILFRFVLIDYANILTIILLRYTMELKAGLILPGHNARVRMEEYK